MTHPNVAATSDIDEFIVRESRIADGEKVCIHCTPGNTAAILRKKRQGFSVKKRSYWDTVIVLENERQ